MYFVYKLWKLPTILAKHKAIKLSSKIMVTSECCDSHMLRTYRCVTPVVPCPAHAVKGRSIIAVFVQGELLIEHGIN